MIRIVKKPMERKSDIVRTARDLFKAKGYDQTTMQNVMDSLDIAKGTIYHYFQSKEALLEAVIEDIVGANIEKMETLISQASGNAIEKIRLWVEMVNIAPR